MIPLAYADIFIAVDEFTGLEDGVIAQGTRPHITGEYHRDYEGNYYIEYAYWTIARHNDSHLVAEIATTNFVVWVEQLDWCWDNYGETVCNNYWLTGIDIVDLRPYGYEGYPYYLEPLEYLRIGLWTETYSEIITYRDSLINQTNYDFFPEEEVEEGF